jgi:hypothetical integral membrane protein (TIGR02206 family)
MTQDLRLFGILHLAVVAAIAAAPFLLARLRHTAAVRKTLALLLVANELVWYAFRYSSEGFRFPEGLPLQLCDVVVWVTVAAAWTGARPVFELGWFWGVAGAGMAILTPDLWAPCWSYPTIYFFLAHGLVVATLLYLVVAGVTRPARGAPWRALLWANVFALAVGAFNAVFGTNYMYLCRKPQGASILDWLGPWPWYLLGGELAALALFWLLALPFRYPVGDGRAGHRAE